MKNFLILLYLLVCLLLPGGPSLYAQEYSLGLKGGLNYSLNNTASEVVGSKGSFTTDSRMGYQAGVFFEIDLNSNLFLRPEVFYNYLEGEFPFPTKPSLYSIEKISIPVLIGYKFYKPFSIFAGPAYQHFLNVELTNIPFEITNQQKNFAAQVGIMYEYKRLQIDLRYDFTFDSKENQRVDIPGLMTNAFFDDGRLNQIMLNLSYKLFDSRLPRLPGFRRQRSCYF